MRAVGETLGFGACEKWTIDTEKSQIVGFRHDEKLIAVLQAQGRDAGGPRDGRDDGRRGGLTRMASKIEDALRKVTALPGVKAALVFDHFNTILARDVPGQYSNDILKRIAGQLSQLSLMSTKSRVQTQEFRLVYEKYAVYVRLFAKNFYLVVFMDRELQSADFRQPLNLSVLVLDRACARRTCTRRAARCRAPRR